jgi:iron(III) transport system substrate-binding protein
LPATSAPPDVINTSDASHTDPLEEERLARRPSCRRDVAKHFQEQYRDPDGMFALTRIWLSSIAYNTGLVKAEDAPKELCRSARSQMGRQDGQGPSRLQRHDHDHDIPNRPRSFGWGYYEKLAKQRVMQVQSVDRSAEEAVAGRARCHGRRQRI